jgi:hypothetical protein
VKKYRCTERPHPLGARILAVQCITMRDEARRIAAFVALGTKLAFAER